MIIYVWFVLQDQVAHLEMELEEERQSADVLMDRIDRGREQVNVSPNTFL